MTRYLALLALTFIAPMFSAQDQGEKLVQDLLTSLNSKNRDTIKEFVSGHFVSAVNPDAFSGRLLPLSERGAPFKLIKIADQSPTMIRALIEDKEPQRLALVLTLQDGKLTRLMINDPESLDAPAPKDYTGWKSLESLAKDVRKDTGSPAIAVAVSRNSPEIETVVDGERSLGKGDPVKPDDLWHLGSITKSITSTLIGKLIEMGKLRWDMTLKEAFPDVAMKPGYESVTLEQVMHHRGGIPRDMNFTGKRVRDLVGTETDPTKLRALYVADILGREPIGKPGERFAYSNAGYAMLGHLAERVMKEPYEKLVHQYVFEPLGIKSAVVGAEALPKERALGHIRNGKTLVQQDMDGPLGVFIAPAGNVMMTISDLVRYGRAHLAGLRGEDSLLKAATVKRLHEDIPEEPGGPGFACGWSVGPLMGTAVRHGHNGSNGTFRAELAIFPDSGLVVAAIVNCGGESEPSPPLQAVIAIAQKYAPGK